MCNQKTIDLEKLWDRFDREALDKKFSHEALVRLSKEYASWDAGVQKNARHIFGKWLSSENPRKRFDALSMIDELSAVETTDDLMQHLDRLEGISGPEARFELDRVERILQRFEEEGLTR